MCLIALGGEERVDTQEMCILICTPMQVHSFGLDNHAGYVFYRAKW